MLSRIAGVPSRLYLTEKSFCDKKQAGRSSHGDADMIMQREHSLQTPRSPEILEMGSWMGFLLRVLGRGVCKSGV